MLARIMDKYAEKTFATNARACVFCGVAIRVCATNGSAKLLR